MKSVALRFITSVFALCLVTSLVLPPSLALAADEISDPSATSSTPSAEGTPSTESSVSVQAVNVAPTAAADSVETRRDQRLTVAAPGVLVNDSDPEAEPLSAQLVSGVSHGTLELRADGSFVYTPANRYVGADSFTYRAFDGESYSAPVAVSITVTEPPADMRPVYHFYNKLNGSHFYTISAEERDIVIARWPAVYTYEGESYYVNVAGTANNAPLYRFYNRVNGSHFYTASAEERDIVIARWSATYTYEGVAYYVSLASSSAAPIYRFYNKVNGSHFYTASAAERDYVAAYYGANYIYEGVAFWADGGGQAAVPWSDPFGYPWGTYILIDKSDFRLYWIQNGRLTKIYPIAHGRQYGWTPNATWRVGAKYVTDPNGVYGPRKMRLYRLVNGKFVYTAYGIHGTNQPWVIGTMASHGCIRMYNADILELWPQVPLYTMVVTRD